MSQYEFVGVDGCPAGWFSVGLDRDGGLGSHRVFGSFAELLEHNADADLVLVDMPIGLPEGSGGRACDGEARQKLASSPVRAYSRRRLDRRSGGLGLLHYKAASEAEYKVSQKRLTRQTFNIANKIAQVDRCLALPRRGCSAASAGGAPRGVFLGVEPSWRYLHLQSYLHEPQKKRSAGRKSVFAFLSITCLKLAPCTMVSPTAFLETGSPRMTYSTRWRRR